MTIEKITLIIIFTLLILSLVIPIYIIYYKYKKATEKIYILEKRNKEQYLKDLETIYNYKQTCEEQREELKKLRLYKKWYESRKKSIRNKQIIEE